MTDKETPREPKGDNAPSEHFLYVWQSENGPGHFISLVHTETGREVYLVSDNLEIAQSFHGLARIVAVEEGSKVILKKFQFLEDIGAVTPYDA